MARKFFQRALIAALAIGFSAANAAPLAREPDPAIWLRKIYDLYHHAETSKETEKQASTELVEARASKALAALFKRDRDCEVKERGICALDWDFIVDGQDWRLSKIDVGALVVAGDKATVMVSFDNSGTACRNIYYFVRENGAWKVDDIETKSGSDAPVRIAKLFRDFDYRK